MKHSLVSPRNVEDASVTATHHECFMTIRNKYQGDATFISIKVDNPLISIIKRAGCNMAASQHYGNVLWARMMFILRATVL